MGDDMHGRPKQADVEIGPATNIDSGSGVAVDPTIELHRQYRGAMHGLEAMFSSHCYEEAEARTSGRKFDPVASVVEHMKGPGPYGNCVESHEGFARYITGYSKLETMPRHTIQPDDATLGAFVISGTVLKKLAELRGQTGVDESDIDAAMTSTAKIYLGLADQIWELDRQAEAAGIAQDDIEMEEAYREHEEERSELEAAREAEIEAAWDEAQSALGEDDGRWDDRDDQEEEELTVEDVANWIGPPGTWT